MAETASKILLVVAAHPDDEVLGCGATVALRVTQGWTAHLLIMATGVAGRYEGAAQGGEGVREEISALEDQMASAAKVLGFHTFERLDFPDNRMDTVPHQDLVHAIRKVIAAKKPQVLYTHHPGDYNLDHGLTFDAVMMAARANVGEFSPGRLFSFEVLSATERAWVAPHLAFHPNTYVDVEKTIDKKKLAMTRYTGEYRPYPHPRSIEGIEYQARMRGLEVGLRYAEAFHLIRDVG